MGSALSSFAHRRVPLHRHGFRSPLPRGLAAPLRQRGCHPSACSALVGSHHLGGFLLRSFAGLLRPAADPGVRRVSGAVDSDRQARRPSPTRSSPSPRRPFRTPRRMILVCSRFHVTVAFASLVFGPPLSRRASPPRPCSAAESGTSSRRCRRWERSRPSWAWFPFKVLRSRRAPALTTPDARSDAASRTSTRSWLRSVPRRCAEARCEVPGRATPSEDGHHGDPSRPESHREFAAMEGRSLSP